MNWSAASGYYDNYYSDYYKGIRSATTFINNIGSNPQFTPEQIVRRMPLPVRFALENRTQGALTFVIVAALIGSGIISIQWQSGQPNVQLHTDRAREVGSQVVEHVRDLRL